MKISWGRIFFLVVIGWFALVGAAYLMLNRAKADGVAAMPDMTGTGSCVLNGAVTPTCTTTVRAGCTPICTYQSSVLPRVVACAVVGTTLTAVALTTLDTGTVSIMCH